MPKIILVQFRHDPEERQMEELAFRSACSTEPVELVAAHPIDGPIPLSLLDDACGIIVGGSAYSVWEPIPNYDQTGEFLKAARTKGLAILGICFGAQLLADVFGGKVERDDTLDEHGTFDLTLAPVAATDPLFAGLPAAFPVQCAHHDLVTRLPADVTRLASTELCPNQAFVFKATRIYGVQFHPERTKAIFEKLLVMRAGEKPAAAVLKTLQKLRETPEAVSLVSRFVHLANG